MKTLFKTLNYIVLIFISIGTLIAAEIVLLQDKPFMFDHYEPIHWVLQFAALLLGTIFGIFWANYHIEQKETEEWDSDFTNPTPDAMEIVSVNGQKEMVWAVTNDYILTHLEEAGFNLVEYNVRTDRTEQYSATGKAIDKRTNGMTILYWNTRGHSVTYFGTPLPKNISLNIRKDGDTRNAFNGYIFNPQQLNLLLNLTW